MDRRIVGRAHGDTRSNPSARQAVTSRNCWTDAPCGLAIHTPYPADATPPNPPSPPPRLPVRPHLLLFIAVAGFALPSPGAPSPAPLQIERAQAAFVLGLGRTPSPEEMQSTADVPSIPALLGGMRKTLQQDRELATAVARKAWRDALGSEPEPAAIANATTEAFTYAELVQRHLQRLAADPDAYRAVIDRAYRRAAHRAPYDIEHTYWAKYDPLPFMLLVACIENWAVRNQPGLMSTTGTPSISVNSGLLRTVRVSPAVADEARAVLGRPLRAADPHGLARGQAVLAPGAEMIVSVGGIHFVATGRSEATR